MMKRAISLVPWFLILFLLAPAVHAAQRSLYLGLSGSNVSTLQTKLISAGYLAAGNATGYFGPLTRAAVQKFQCAQKIVCSGGSYGVYGPQTQAALAMATAVPVQPGDITKPLTAAATGAFELSGWMPDWRASSSTLDVLPHLSQLDSVMPFGYKVGADGTIVDPAHFAQEPWTSFIVAAKAKKVRIIPTVEWGNGAQEQAILSNTAKRIALEDEIAGLVKRNGFDGIDIDFEAKQAETINYFSTFLKGLYARMGSKWVYCTIEARMPLEDRYSPGANVPDDATVYANDFVEMNKYCDRVEVMAYDQGTIDVRLNAARFAPYAPVADPGWVEDLARLAAQTISRNKLILGLATYGYEYQVAPVSGSYQYDRLWAFNPNYALGIAQTLGITPSRNSAGELGFTYSPSVLAAKSPTNGDTTQTQQSTPTSTTAQNEDGISGGGPLNYVTWSDAQAIADKVALAHRLGLRGVAVFSLGGAEDPNMWNVLK